MPPATAPASLRSRLVVEITGKKALSGLFAGQPNDELAIYPPRNVAIVLVDHLRFQRWDGTADRTGAGPGLRDAQYAQT